MTSRTIPISAHATIEIIAAPILMAAPFVLGFSAGAAAVTFALGAVLMGLAVTTAGEERSLTLRAHAGFDRGFAITTVLAGIAVGLVTHDVLPTIFLAGFGAAHLVLTASTRYSARGA